MSTEEQSQAISSLSLACLAWDFVCLSLEDTSVPVPARQLVFPGTAPAVLLSHGDGRQMLSGGGPSLGQAILALVHDWSVSVAQRTLPVLPLTALRNPSSWLHG